MEQDRREAVDKAGDEWEACTPPGRVVYVYALTVGIRFLIRPASLVIKRNVLNAAER